MAFNSGYQTVFTSAPNIYRMKTILKITAFLFLLGFCQDEGLASVDREASDHIKRNHLFKKISHYDELGDEPKILQEAYDYLEYGFTIDRNLKEIDKKLTLKIDSYKNSTAIVPEKRTIRNTDFNETIQFSAYGYKTKLPWKEHDEIYSTDSTSIVKRTDNWLVALENPTESRGLFYYETWKSVIIDSNFFDYPEKKLFEYIKLILSTIPTNSHNRTNLHEIVKEKTLQLTLLIQKHGYTTVAKKRGNKVESIYAFSEKNIKGFQIGHPDTSKYISLLLFPDDNTEIHIAIIKGDSGIVSQKHIDFIIHNFALDR